jgi:hypothetical protein
VVSSRARLPFLTPFLAGPAHEIPSYSSKPKHFLQSLHFVSVVNLHPSRTRTIESSLDGRGSTLTKLPAAAGETTTDGCERRGGSYTPRHSSERGRAVRSSPGLQGCRVRSFPCGSPEEASNSFIRVLKKFKREAAPGSRRT